MSIFEAVFLCRVIHVLREEAPESIPFWYFVNCRMGSGKLQDVTEIGAGLGGAGSTAPLVGFSLSRREL